MDLVVELHQPAVFVPYLTPSATSTFPAGFYTPMMEDSGGVYFQAPGKIISASLAGAVLQDGGIYLKTAEPNALYGYVITDFGKPIPMRLPDATRFSVRSKFQ